MGLIIPVILWPLVGILGLLFFWRQHRQKLTAGLISPMDICNPSGIHWYLYAVPDDADVCSSCRETTGTAFLARKVTHLSLAPALCHTPEKCFAVLIPFAGGWLESNDVMAQLREEKTGSRRLSQQELGKLTGVEWTCDVGNLDCPGLHLLSAFLQERKLPIQAIRSYGAVLDLAKLPRDQALLISAYMRLAGMLARSGNPKKAVQVIEHFEKRVARADAGTFTPTGKQRRVLSTMKPYLYSLIDQDMEKVSKPATVHPSDGTREP